MRKTTTLKTLAAAALTLLSAACAKEQLSDNGGQAGVSFTVEVPGAPATKAIGDGTTATKLYYQVFDGNKNPIEGLGVQETTLTGKTAKVNFQLVKDQTYNFIFWAQTSESGYYTFGTDGLTQITANYAGKKANDENFDAFFAVEKALKISGPVTKDITLKRPFAQINIASNDKISAGGTAQPIDFAGATSMIAIKGLPTTFSPLTDALAGADEAYVEFAAASAPLNEIKVNEVTYTNLAMNYVFAPADGTVCDIKATLTVDGKDVKLEVPNTPIKRNWRTNIVGKVLTTSTDFNVVIDPGFDGDDNQHPVFVNGVAYKTLDAAVTAVPAGVQTIIKLEQDVAGNGIRTTDGQDIVIDFGGHTFNIDGTTVGSAGTPTNGLQLLKGSKVTLRNGTIKSTKANILIQNYCDLTLEDVTIDASESVGIKEGSYAVSNNHGTVKILGSTSILAPAGKVAFDVYYHLDSVYKDGVNVYVNTTGTISGAIEYGCKKGFETASETLSSLVIDNAVLENSSFKTALANPNVKIACGVFADEAAVNAWIPTGYNAVKTGDYYIVTNKTVNVVGSQEDLAAAVSTSDAMVKLESGSYTLPSNIADGITIVGTDGTVIDLKAAGAPRNVTNATFKNIEFVTFSADYNGFQHNNNLLFDGCTFTGKHFGYGTEIYKNCTFVQESGDYNMWTYGGNIDYIGCTFKGKGKFLNIYNEGLEAKTINVKNCKFINTGDSNKPAINIKGTSGANALSFTVNIDGCTVEGNFPSINGGLWQVDDEATAESNQVTVNVDGTKVYLN